MKGKKSTLPVINTRIRDPRVKLILHDGTNMGEVPREQALKLAEEAGMDLVLLSESEDGQAPIVKIIDFGKSLYEKKKKLSDAKKHQKVIQVKEIKISPKIGEHDYQIKMNQAIRFLEEGKRVKITLIFRRRENATRNDRGPEIFAKIDKTFEEHDLLKNLAQEKDAKAGHMWCRIYYLKNAK